MSDCKGFQWVGQDWDTCHGCGQPYWEHSCMEHPAEGSGPFDEAWEYRPISDEARARMKARYAATA